MKTKSREGAAPRDDNCFGEHMTVIAQVVHGAFLQMTRIIALVDT